MPDDVVAYYRQFLHERPWHAEGLSWTVIQPASEPVTEDVVLRRLRGQRVDLTEIHFPHVNDFRPGMPDESKVAYLTQVGPAVVMFQPSGFEGARREVLRWLSDGARVHNVDWTINGNGGISYAVYGKVLAWVDKNDPGRRHGEQPDVLDNDLGGLREARRRWDAGDLAGADFSAEAMALVERRTGVRLDVGWVDGFEEPGPAVMIGDIPSDPTPPGRLGNQDPDLDARLRSAPEHARRAALALVARTLAGRFTFSDPEAVASTVDSIERGVPLAPEVRTRMFRSLATGDAEARSAINGLYAATAPPGRHVDEPLDLLHAATYALPDEWPRVRQAIDGLLRG
ncbi:DUF6461 domain-containing protein [Micromonospora yasonensis]|uniref:DUF6461 domain-containing protein n=1 Tax=Micromonospora yasonensis TaxID=1128667 RepID=UPI002232431E|nr:DUF6461 domain-containing protein [Micromonospora yasonensis]MCW3841503.1 DUF6461 domain-containing protein [Micromonospora yasonensis]